MTPYNIFVTACYSFMITEVHHAERNNNIILSQVMYMLTNNREVCYNYMHTDNLILGIGVYFKIFQTVQKTYKKVSHTDK